MKPLKIKIRKSPANQKWYFVVVSGNNQIIAQGQAYKQIASVYKTVRRLKQAMKDAEIEVEKA